jgi:hypothetical protein
VHEALSGLGQAPVVKPPRDMPEVLKKLCS